MAAEHVGGVTDRRSRRRAVAELFPRFDRSRPTAALDTSLPAVVLWASQFPLQHGCLGVFRSLGRGGVPVYAVVGDPRAPIIGSRYLRGQILWQPHLGDGYADLIERLLDFGRRLGRRSLIVCTSDEMAVLVARHRAMLEEWFVLPDVAPELPDELAHKHTLTELCLRYGAPVPRSVSVDTMAELDASLDQLNPPVVVKSIALRGQFQNIENTTILSDRDAVRELAQTWTEPYRTLLQEYLPDEQSEDWIAHGYCGADAEAKVVFTGRKVRSWPIRGGATAAAYTAVNPELAALTESFCRQVGYRGIFDIDWRRDLRTGTYYLLDFNPRVGAQFRMFENCAGIDVVRAMHLDLSGRPVPAGEPIDGERFVVEPWDVAGLLASRHSPIDAGGIGRPRMAWLAADDQRPVMRMVLAQARLSLTARIRRLLPGRWPRRSAPG